MTATVNAAWQKALQNIITSPENLLDRLQLDKNIYLAAAQKVCRLFGLKVTESFVERMEKKNPFDPLLLQILPLHLELNNIKNYSPDPLQEKKFNPIPGLLHKYNSRVLITLTGHCAVHCRYCFRRSFPYHENNAGKNNWNAMFAYISQYPDINEIILSGGDPLSAPDKLLSAFGEKILACSQLKTLRIHSRLPIVLPERITSGFIHWLKNFPLKKVLVLHINHPNEINTAVISKIQALKKADITLLNQSVLLKNINNNIIILNQLSEKLFSAGILPYYLHLPDKVQGTAHFKVSESQAKSLIKSLQEMLPGYLVPKLVKEVPGEKHKTMII